MKKLSLKIVSIALLGYSTLAFSVEYPATNEPFYKRDAEGYFWYEKPLEDEVKKVEPPKIQPKPENPVEVVELRPAPSVASEDIKATAPETSPAMFSVKWMNEMLPKYRDTALDNPTTDNVRAYFLLQRVAMDRANKFADVAAKVVSGDPMLDELSNRPFSAFGADRMNRQAGEKKSELLKNIAKNKGLFFFYRSDCPYCKAFAPILNKFRELYGFTIITIALDGKPMPGKAGELFNNWRPNSGQAERLGVATVPAVFLASGKEGFSGIGQGLMALNELAARTLTAASKKGWISDQDYAETRPIASDRIDLSDLMGSSSTGELSTLAKEANPQDLIKLVNDYTGINHE